MNRSLLACALTCAVALTAACARADVSSEPGVTGFIEEMSGRHHFDTAELERLFRQVEIREDILSAIARPAESKPWHQYRPIFITQSRILEGVEFWREHADLLNRVEAEYGVSSTILVAILGVETRYGRHRGNYRVMDALSTLAFGYPKRAGFFRGQLEQYLLMAREEGIDPLALSGSYAGAMGQPQFIPSSFRAYAVDFDRDGRRDLWDNIADVVGSIANYFRRHDWQRGEPVATPATVEGDRFRLLVEKGYKPHTPFRRLADFGVIPRDDFPDDRQAALIELEAADGPEHWVVMHNFYVITRYNHSPLYAMAVYQLSEAIRAIVSGPTAGHAG